MKRFKPEMDADQDQGVYRYLCGNGSLNQSGQTHSRSFRKHNVSLEDNHAEGDGDTGAIDKHSAEGDHVARKS